jgi:hypothetical protein
VAFDGTDFLVVWQDDQNSSNDVYGARVTRTGSVREPFGFAIGQGVGAQELPTLAFDGAYYVVAWNDDRTVSGSHDLYGARVLPLGSVLDPGGLRLSAAGTHEYPPAAVRGPRGITAIAYTRIVPEAPYGGARRAFLRFFDEQIPPIVSCSVPRVVGLRLPGAKTRIRHGHCRVGRVRHARSRRVGRVLGQNPRAGARRPQGTRVNLLVGRR